MQEDAAIEQLSAYLDGELTETEVAELELRLARDAALRTELDALRGAVDLLRTHGPVQAPPALYGDILRAVEDEPMPGGWWAWLQRPFGLPLPTVALAGVAIAVVGVTVGGTVVATAPGVLRPAVSDIDYDGLASSSSVKDAKEELAKSDDASRTEQAKPAPATPSREDGVADVGDGTWAGEADDAERSKQAVVADVEPAETQGTADDELSGDEAGEIENPKNKKLADKASYGGSGTMYSGGPVVSVGLRPEDLERVAALYQKFAGTRSSSANASAEKLASLPRGTSALTLNLPDAQARNAFEQELKKAFPGSFQSAPASEDGFTLDHARMQLRITVADQFPGSSGGELEQPPIQTLRKRVSPAESPSDAMDAEQGSSTKE